jgi:hypothetical protein
MVMIKVTKIAFMAVVTLVMTFAFSCSNQTDTTLTQQQTSISNYLKSSHQPRLIPEAEISESLEANPEFYSQWGLDIYRYVATYYDEDRQSKPVVALGDEVALRYSAYIFKNSRPSTDNLFATNDEARIAELEAKGLNTSYEWTTEPLEAILGQGDILEGIEIAIEGCREGDSIEVYLTFESGYGNKYVGMVPGKSAQVWYIDILKVTKK